MRIESLRLNFNILTFKRDQIEPQRRIATNPAVEHIAAEAKDHFTRARSSWLMAAALANGLT